MLTKADLALYRAKDPGRNQYRFHIAELDEQAQERMTIGRDLHQAIERGEFELFYQPQVELTSRRIVGMEALIRWNHPSRGRLSPSLFIPVAESNGTIFAIGRWVVEQACRRMHIWLEHGIAPRTIAVNVSAAQLQAGAAFDRIVQSALSASDIPPQALELELTESTLMESAQRHDDPFANLRAIGVRLAIDDFGTGFSSLGYLSSSHMTRLKLAIKFIRDVTTNPENAAIVRATIGLARELGIGLVAEGVNTVEQCAFLLASGGAIGQGFSLGGPVAADRMTTLLAEQIRSEAA
jgi:EAL domain-containing protein (putative c-di-GMP-specific phosphodiesterase class I)